MSRVDLRLAGVAAAACGALAAVAVVGGQSASGWDLSWNAITGGGGKSSAAEYQLQGAVVPVAGSSSGAGYVLQGGFFAGEPVKFLGFTPSIAKDGVN
ncbi:MAG: hypothetical protein ACRDHF_06850 [Tepidiformaceae bacterium]